MRERADHRLAAEAAAADGDVIPVNTIATRCLGGSQPLQDPDFIQRLAEAQTASLACLNHWDQTGDWWAKGRLAALRTLAKADTRFAFVDALPRSISFGRFLADIFAKSLGQRALSPKSIALAEAINAFVTLFDGICDEAPESLPVLLPALTATFKEMDGQHRPNPSLRDPASVLLVELANACFCALSPRLTGISPVAAAARGAIRLAFESEIASLNAAFGAEDIAAQITKRETLSSATFDATFQCLCLLEEQSPEQSRYLKHLSEACGAFFGWIDDVADLQTDRMTSQPNLVDLCACVAEVADDDRAAFISDETARRWSHLEQVVGDLPIGRDLRFAAQAWLM